MNTRQLAHMLAHNVRIQYVKARLSAKIKEKHPKAAAYAARLDEHRLTEAKLKVEWAGASKAQRDEALAHAVIDGGAGDLKTVTAALDVVLKGD